MDRFTCYVLHVTDHGTLGEEPEVSVVEVLAARTTEATLMAIELVAARGRVPVAVEVDWDDF